MLSLMDNERGDKNANEKGYNYIDDRRDIDANEKGYNHSADDELE